MMGTPSGTGVDSAGKNHAKVRAARVGVWVWLAVLFMMIVNDMWWVFGAASYPIAEAWFMWMVIASHPAVAVGAVLEMRRAKMLSATRASWISIVLCSLSVVGLVALMLLFGKFDFLLVWVIVLGSGYLAVREVRELPWHREADRLSSEES